MFEVQHGFDECFKCGSGGEWPFMAIPETQQNTAWFAKSVQELVAQAHTA